VTLSRKGAKSRTHARGLRSKTTKARTHVDRLRAANTLKRKLTEALEQQAATSEILRVIRSSPSNVQPVFDTIAANAVRLCNARMGAVHLFDGELVHIVAFHNFPPEAVEVLRRMYPRPPQSDQASGRAILTRAVAQIEDMPADPQYTPEVTIAGQWRSILAVPMFRDDNPVGAIVITRSEAGRFAQEHIDLLKTFADQAVIAIENVRLFTELQASNRDLSEALQQQTATADVLKVISRSTFDLQSVLQALIESATRLCGAPRGHILQFDGEYLRLAAAFGAWPGFTNYLETHPLRLGRGTIAGKAAFERRTIHVRDVLQEPDYELTELIKQQGYRTVLAVPMLREGALRGVIVMVKTELEPFTDKQIELVETFADQAVIAIENVRLFDDVQARTRELSEALEHQTATSEVLNVISRSPTDAQPVFDAIVQSAARLCQAVFSLVFLYDGDLLRLAATHNFTPEVLKTLFQTYPKRPDRSVLAGRAVLDGRITHVPDLLADQEYSHQLALAGNWRAGLAVPMLRDGKPVGAISVARAEPVPFSDRQIQLLTTFADQAVIAIENVRLFDDVQARTRELSEALEQQTATSEVLQTISGSPGELQPVFDAMLEKATRICEANFGLLHLCDGDAFRTVAMHNAPPAYLEHKRRDPMVRNLPHDDPLQRVSDALRVIQVADAREEAAYRRDGTPGGTFARLTGVRSLLEVPMLKDNKLIGVIAIYRQEVRPFSDKQIELITNFARQAVIAIENTRLLNELRESLQQQTATADVLKVISRSTFDLQTVLQTLVESAAHLCDADQGTITRQRDGVFYRAEAYGFPPEFIEMVRDVPVKPERGSMNGRTLLEGKVLHVPDVLADPDYTFTGAQRLGGYRTILGIPMLREGKPIGVLTLTRKEVRPFTEKQIELVSTFADQAAIAIENVRLFDEIQDKNRQLQLASENKSQFVSSMSHELRTPLNAIIGLTEMMVKNAARFGTEKAQEPLQRVNRAGTQLLGLINQVLDLSKIEAGKLELNPQTVQLAPLINDVISTAGQLAEQNKNRLVVDAQENLGALTVDPMRLRQILLNLLSNACKFTKAGEVKLAARKVRNGSNIVEFAVADTGIGHAAAFALGSNVPEPAVSIAANCPHSINSSASSRNGSGMVSPIDFAVLRLTTSSNCVGRSIGRSPGLMPARNQS
jgi:GAF domain-containing protein